MILEKTSKIMDKERNVIRFLESVEMKVQGFESPDKLMPKHTHMILRALLILAETDYDDLGKEYQQLFKVDTSKKTEYEGITEEESWISGWPWELELRKHL